MWHKTIRGPEPEDRMQMRLQEFVVASAIALVLAGCGSSLSEPDQTGTIRALDTTRALVVTPQNGGAPHPTWYGIDEETELTGARDYVFKDLKIGWKVRAWYGGMVDLSQPGQTRASRFEIVSEDDLPSDVQGRIESVRGPGDGEAYWTIGLASGTWTIRPDAPILLNREPSSESELHVGDDIELWTPGYQLHDELVAAQVNILRP